jgi:hypothetical protein
MRGANHFGQGFVVDGRIVKCQLRGDNSKSLILDDMFQLGEGGLLCRREERMEVVVFGLIVAQIVRVPAERIQQAERVVLKRRLDLPIGARGKGGGLCMQNGRVSNLDRTLGEGRAGKESGASSSSKLPASPLS